MKLPHLLPLALVLGACATTSGPAPVAGPDALPVPTEHRLTDDAEASNKAARKAWYRERHRAAPDVDWKAIEAANGAAALAGRNQLAMAATVGAPSRWTERGSRNQAGRVHAATHSPDGSKLYVGSSKAGIWRGQLDGTEWTPLADGLYGGAHWLAATPGLLPSDPDRLLAATDGGSVHYSIDDGATWHAPAGLPGNLSSVRRVTTATDGTWSVFLLGRTGSARRLYRSDDGGLSFQLAYDLGSFDGDVFCDRTGGIDMYVLGPSGVELSRDGGRNWIFHGALPVSATGGELCGSEAGAPRLYAVLHTTSGNQLYRSNNAGKTWTWAHAVSDYWGSLNASTIDKDLVAWGGVEVHRSTDAGASFHIVNSWAAYYGDPVNKLHADIPGLDVVSTGPGTETWYVSTDGGLYESTDGLATVLNRSLDGLRISQYYTTLTSTVDPDHVVAGSQDQGWQWTDQPAPAGGTSYDLDQVISGDYGHAVSSDGTHKYVYSVYPGFVLVHKGESNPTVQQVSFPPGESYSWLPFLAPDKGAAGRFFFCATKLYRYQKSGGSWTPSAWSTQDFAQSSGEYLTGVAIAPIHQTHAVAVTNKGKLWWSNDGAVTWSQGTPTGPSAHYFYGTAVLAKASDPNTFYVGGSGYSNPPVWRTTDGGKTWAPWSTGLPSTLVYSLAEAPDGSGSIFCGTETGAYRRDPGGDWYDILKDDAPLNIYWSAEAVAATNTIRFGTYGRGMWDYSVDAPCPYEAYGAGAGGANVLTLTAGTPAGLGATHVFEVSGASGAHSGLVGAGFGQLALPLLGGTLLVDPTGMVPFLLTTDATGTGTAQVPVPANPTLAGLGVFVQAVLFDAGQPGGLAFSNGLSGVLCE